MAGFGKILLFGPLWRPFLGVVAKMEIVWSILSSVLFSFSLK
jgi:hypothetical protein